MRLSRYSTKPSLVLNFVVGDGAAPETAMAVSRFSDPRIRWFNNFNGGNFTLAGIANGNFMVAGADALIETITAAVQGASSIAGHRVQPPYRGRRGE